MLTKLAIHRIRILKQHPPQLLFQVLVPVILVFLLGWFQQVSTNDFRVPIAVVDEDHSQYSELIVSRLQPNPAINLLSIERSQAERLLSQNKVDSIFILDTGLEQKLLGGDENVITVEKTSMSLAYPLIREVVASQVLRLNSNVMAADKVVSEYKELGIPADQNVWSDAWKYTDSQWEPKPLMTIDYNDVESDKAISVEQPWSGQIKNVQGWLLIILMLAAMLSTNWLINEQKDGVLKRIQASNIKLFTYVLGNSFPFLIIWIIDIVIVLAGATLFCHVPLNESIRLCCRLIVFVFFCWSMGIGLVSIIKSNGFFQLFVVFITFVTSLFSGVIVHLPTFVTFIDNLSLMTPQHWALLVEMRVGLPVLAGMTLVVLFISHWNFRRNFVV